MYRALVGPLYPRSWEQIRGFLNRYDLPDQAPTGQVLTGEQVAGLGVIGVDLWQPVRERPAVPSPMVAGLGRLTDHEPDHARGEAADRPDGGVAQRP